MRTKQYKVEGINPPPINDSRTKAESVIEVIFNRPITHDEALEWWRKINAMPALLEACKRLVEIWEGPRERAGIDFAAAIVETRKAIALAEPAEKGE